MARRVFYRILDEPGNVLSDQEWEGVERLQHWYNSEFFWSSGKLLLKRYVIFPNDDLLGGLDKPVAEIIRDREATLRAAGLSERDMVAQLEREGLLFVKWGGYAERSLASGYTRVADNEWNAYLACDFMLKVSTMVPGATCEVEDEGHFIKTGCVWFRNGEAVLPLHRLKAFPFLHELMEGRHIFTVVDPGKFDRHPAFRDMVPGIRGMNLPDRRTLVRNWNWQGFGAAEENEMGGERGADLNAKVRSFRTIE